MEVRAVLVMPHGPFKLVILKGRYVGLPPRKWNSWK